MIIGLLISLFLAGGFFVYLLIGGLLGDIKALRMDYVTWPALIAIIVATILWLLIIPLTLRLIRDRYWIKNGNKKITPKTGLFLWVERLILYWKDYLFIKIFNLINFFNLISFTLSIVKMNILAFFNEERKTFWRGNWQNKQNTFCIVLLVRPKSNRTSINFFASIIS